MKWQIDYYNVRVKKAIKAWPNDLLARYFRITDLIISNGANLGMPFTKSLGNSLFEIRVKGKSGIGRAFFCYCINKKIVVLHGFIKKTQGTPQKELEIAKKRMKEVMSYEI